MNQDQARQKCLKIPEVVGRMILMLDPESLLIVPRTVADMEFVKKKVHSRIFRLKILHHQFHLNWNTLVWTTLDYKDIRTTGTFGLSSFGLSPFGLFWTTGTFGLQGQSLSTFLLLHLNPTYMKQIFH